MAAGNGAIAEFMELIYAAAQPVIEREQMTDEQAVNFMTSIFDRMIVQTVTEKPATAERLLAAFAADVDAKYGKQ